MNFIIYTPTNHRRGDLATAQNSAARLELLPISICQYTYSNNPNSKLEVVEDHFNQVQGNPKVAGASRKVRKNASSCLIVLRGLYGCTKSTLVLNEGNEGEITTTAGVSNEISEEEKEAKQAVEKEMLTKEERMKVEYTCKEISRLYDSLKDFHLLLYSHKHAFHFCEIKRFEERLSVRDII